MDALTAKITPERFAALIRTADFKKIEAALPVSPAPSEDLRQSLTLSFWAFYENSLPKAKIKVSRRALKEDLQRAAAILSEAAELMPRLYKSGVGEVAEPFNEFMPSHHWPGFIADLNGLSLRAQRIDNGIPDDKGGNHPGLAFDNLTKELAGYYCARSKTKTAPTSQKEPFFWFMWAVVQVLSEVGKRLPAGPFDLPKNHKALEMRLRRLETRPYTAGEQAYMKSDATAEPQ
jgi:hypothetical protein